MPAARPAASYLPALTCDAGLAHASQSLMPMAPHAREGVLAMRPDGAHTARVILPHTRVAPQASFLVALRSLPPRLPLRTTLRIL